MTKSQRMSILLTRWPAACRAQGWDHQDRTLRLQTLSLAAGRPIQSMNDLDNSRDIDRVYAHLAALADNIDGAVELTPSGADYGDRRRLLWLIRKHAQPLGGDPYIVALARDKFHLTEGLTTIDDLSTKQLEHLMFTLNARRHKKQRHQEAAAVSPTVLPTVLEPALAIAGSDLSDSSDSSDPF